MYQELNTFKMPKGFRGKSIIFVQLWRIVLASFFRFSPQFMYGWRRLLLRLFGAEIGTKVQIRPTAKILYPWKLTIGNWSWIGDEVILYNMEHIRIGDNCVISQKSYLCSSSHDHTKPSFDIFAKPIEIMDEVWIATDVFIAPGVTIGKGAVVGYRSTVNTDLLPEMICYGNPAKAISPRTKV